MRLLLPLLLLRLFGGLCLAAFYSDTATLRETGCLCASIHPPPGRRCCRRRCFVSCLSAAIITDPLVTGCFVKSQGTEDSRHNRSEDEVIEIITSDFLSHPMGNYLFYICTYVYNNFPLGETESQRL